MTQTFAIISAITAFICFIIAFDSIRNVLKAVSENIQELARTNAMIQTMCRQNIERTIRLYKDIASVNDNCCSNQAELLKVINGELNKISAINDVLVKGGIHVEKAIKENKEALADIRAAIITRADQIDEMNDILNDKADLGIKEARDNHEDLKQAAMNTQSSIVGESESLRRLTAEHAVETVIYQKQQYMSLRALKNELGSLSKAAKEMNLTDKEAAKILENGERLYTIKEK